MASDALGSHQSRPAGNSIKGYGLVAAVHAGNVASAAAYALVGMKNRENYGITVQVMRQVELGQ